MSKIVVYKKCINDSKKQRILVIFRVGLHFPSIELKFNAFKDNAE